jgi:hypothetical protein
VIWLVAKTRKCTACKMKVLTKSAFALFAIPTCLLSFVFVGYYHTGIKFTGRFCPCHRAQAFRRWRWIVSNIFKVCNTEIPTFFRNPHISMFCVVTNYPVGHSLLLLLRHAVMAVPR